MDFSWAQNHIIPSIELHLPTQKISQIAPEALDQLIRILLDNLAHLIHCSDHTSCFRAVCNDGKVVSLCFQYGSTSHLWLSSTWKVASDTEVCIYMYLILINLNSHMWLVVTVLGNAGVCCCLAMDHQLHKTQRCPVLLTGFSPPTQGLECDWHSLMKSCQIN